MTSRPALTPGIVKPVAISTPALLDWEDREIIRNDALEVFAAASASSKSRLEEELDNLILDV